MQRFLLRGALVFSLALLPGCGSDSKPFTPTKNSSLTNPENVRTWANGASAFGVYGNIYTEFAVADGEQTYDDPACPVLEDDDTTLTMTGDCTDSSGKAWIGSATVERSASGDRTLTLDGFGTKDDDGGTDTKTGSAHLRLVDDMNTDFDLDLTHDGGLVSTFDYAGRIQGSYDSDRTVWSGAGSVSRDGLIAPNGTVDATTTDEVVDNTVCAGAPVSGNTTIHNEADETAVVTYDGDVDCDDDQAASYSLDGVPKGKITGIACSLSPGRSSAGAAAWLLALALLAAGRRRAA